MAKQNMRTKQKIKLLNYSTSPIGVTTGEKDYLFEGARDGSPVAYYFRWDEIEAINSRCSAIKTGAIVFSAEDMEDGYATLNLHDWKETIMFDEVIDDIIANPTLENLERVLAIRDINTIERFRGKMGSHINNGRGVDSRFMDVVNGRFKEINSGIYKSKILLKPTVDYSGVNDADVIELKAKNVAMETELAEMKAIMAELMKQQNSAPKETNKTEVSDDSDSK